MRRQNLLILLTALPLLIGAEAAQAYVGPGAGITAIGTVLALIGAGILAVVGFVWYPLKRLLGRRKAAGQPASAAAPRKE